MVSMKTFSGLVVGKFWAELLKWALVWLISPESVWKLRLHWSRRRVVTPVPSSGPGSIICHAEVSSTRRDLLSPP